MSSYREQYRKMLCRSNIRRAFELHIALRVDDRQGPDTQRAVPVADRPLNADDFGLQPSVFNMLHCEPFAFFQNLLPEPMRILRTVAIPSELPDCSADIKDIHLRLRILALLLKQFLPELEGLVE